MNNLTGWCAYYGREEPWRAVALRLIALFRLVVFAPTREAFYRTVWITVLVIVLVVVVRVPLPALPELPPISIMWITE